MPDDLIVIAGNNMYTWLNIWNGKAATGNWTTPFPTAPAYNSLSLPAPWAPCQKETPTATPTTVVVGQAPNVCNANPCVFVGCSDGFIEAYEYTGGVMLQLIHTRVGAPAQLATISALALGPAATAQQLVAIDQGANRLVLMSLTTAQTGQIDPAAKTMSFLPDIALRTNAGDYVDPATAGNSLPGFAFNAASVPSTNPPACALVRNMAIDSMPYSPPYAVSANYNPLNDFHLAPDSYEANNVCIAKGIPGATNGDGAPAVTDDYDGDSRTSVPKPDVGADQRVP